MLEFLSSDLEAFRCHAAGAGKHRRSIGCDVVRNIMLDGAVFGVGLCDLWKFREEGCELV